MVLKVSTLLAQTCTKFMKLEVVTTELAFWVPSLRILYFVCDIQEIRTVFKGCDNHMARKKQVYR